MRISRKQSRFIALLLLWWGWSTPSVFAQNFDPVTPTETITQEIADGMASISQFSELSALAAQQQLTSDITAFMATPEADNYFDTNFDPDGAYGQRKSGLITTDWETPAKGMGATGAVLAGAYALWRSRRRDYLGKLRAGDEKLVMELFSKEFGNGQTTPKTGEQWEEWAISHGLAGAGGIIATLFAIWKRKETPVSAELDDSKAWLAGLYQVTDQKHWLNGRERTGFYYAVNTAITQKNEREYQAAIKAQNIVEPDPIPSLETAIGYNPRLSHVGSTSNHQSLLNYFSAGVSGNPQQQLSQIIQRLVNENAKRTLAGKPGLNIHGVMRAHYIRHRFSMGYNPSYHGDYSSWASRQASNKYYGYARNLQADSQTKTLISNYTKQKNDYNRARSIYLQATRRIQSEIYRQNDLLRRKAHEHWKEFDQAHQDAANWDTQLQKIAQTVDSKNDQKIETDVMQEFDSLLGSIDVQSIVTNKVEYTGEALSIPLAQKRVQINSRINGLEHSKNNIPMMINFLRGKPGVPAYAYIGGQLKQLSSRGWRPVYGDIPQKYKDLFAQHIDKEKQAKKHEYTLYEKAYRQQQIVRFWNTNDENLGWNQCRKSEGYQTNTRLDESTPREPASAIHVYCYGNVHALHQKIAAAQSELAHADTTYSQSLRLTAEIETFTAKKKKI